MTTTQNEVDEIRKQLFTDIPEVGIGEALDKAEAAITKLIEKARLEERRRLFNEIMERCDDAMKDIIKDLEKL